MPDAITATMDANLLAALAAARADAMLWRERTLSTRDVLNLVEDVSDDPTPENVQALVDAFDAWRASVESRGHAMVWFVAGEPGAGDGGDQLGLPIEDIEPPF